YQGVKEVSRTVLDNGRMLGMSERQLMQHVYWPSALSWMFSSLHTSVGFAVVGAVVGEYLGSAAGLGYLIQQAEGIFDVADEVARLHRDFLVAEPDRAGALQNVLDLVGVGMHVLGHIADLDRDGGAIGAREHLGTEADGVRVSERVALHLAGMDDLRSDVFRS